MQHSNFNIQKLYHLKIVKLKIAIAFWYEKMCNFTFWATHSTVSWVLTKLFLSGNSCGQGATSSNLPPV